MPVESMAICPAGHRYLFIADIQPPCLICELAAERARADAAKREAAEAVIAMLHEECGSNHGVLARLLDRATPMLSGHQSVMSATDILWLLRAKLNRPDGKLGDMLRDLITERRDAIAHRDRLRAAGRALLACPHIAERDTDPDWVDAETEAAVAEMRAALKET